MLFHPSEQLLTEMVKHSTVKTYIYTGHLPPVSMKFTYSPV